MNNKQINIRIAEACGWTFINQVDKRLHGLPPDGKKDRYTSPLPDYCNDLNAMHEAEKWISEKCKEGDYWFFLRELLDFPEAESDWDKFYIFGAIHATARQRAEAFLKTLGKWEGEA